MNTTRKTPPRHSGFTLVELLVVIAILVILVGLLSPSLGRARILAFRGACGNSVREIANACRAYALDGKMNRGTIGQAMPSIRGGGCVGTGNWGDMTQTKEFPSGKGNPGCLWLLVQHGHTSTSTFACPEAGWRRSLGVPDNKGFTPETYSYSYLSQVEFTVELKDEPKQTYSVTTLMDAAAQLVIVGDQNPRCEPGKTKINENKREDKDKSLQNSLNHKREGQNVGRWDGSVVWLTNCGLTAEEDKEGKTILVGDDIYASENASLEANGQRGNLNDAFLIP